MMMEPGRLWKRYLIGNFVFLGLVLAQLLGWLPPKEGQAKSASANARGKALHFKSPSHAKPDYPQMHDSTKSNMSERESMDYLASVTD
jgi:hypothetical protein